MAKKRGSKAKIKYQRESYPGLSSEAKDFFGFSIKEEKEETGKRRKYFEKTLNTPLISKSRRTTKSRGRALRVSAQSGIRGFWK